MEVDLVEDWKTSCRWHKLFSKGSFGLLGWSRLVQALIGVDMRRVVMSVKLLHGAVLVTEYALRTEWAVLLSRKLSAIHLFEAIAVAGDSMLGELHL